MQPQLLLMSLESSTRTKVYPGTSKFPWLDKIFESKWVSEMHIMSNLLIKMQAQRRYLIK